MALNTAIRHLKKGDWEKAHQIVQNDPSEMGCWAHGIVHLLEGDLGNARYWFRRARRPFPQARDASVEIDALVATLKRQAEANHGGSATMGNSATNGNGATSASSATSGSAPSRRPRA